MAAEINCMVTNWESAVFTLPAQEKASLLGGSYHQLMIAGPTRLQTTKPATAPATAPIAVLFAVELPANAASAISALGYFNSGVSGYADDVAPR